MHHWQINSALSANDVAIQHQVAEAGGLFGGGMQGMEAALRMIDGQVMQQALVMTFSDMYLALGVAGLVSIPLALFLRPAKPGSAMGAMH